MAHSVFPVRTTTIWYKSIRINIPLSDQRRKMRGLNLDSHLKAFMGSLRKLQEKEVMTDVTLILPDQSAVLCHKVILMAASPFFESIFKSELKEGAEQNIKLDFADSDTIKTLAHCEEYLADTVGLSNCIDYYRYGKLLNLKVLIKTAFDFALSKFQKFEEISDFDILTEDELVEVVSSDRLNVENEDVVFEAVVHWVNVDRDAREEVFPRIAPLIRFPFCTQSKLTDEICCSSLMLKSECIPLALEALWSQFHFNCHPATDNARCIPRQAFNSSASLFQLMESKSPNKVSLSVALFTASGIKWESVLPCITRTFDRIITSPSGLYLINKNDCYFVEPKLKRVTPFPWKPVDQDSALAFIDGKIFAFGRTSAENSESGISVERPTSIFSTAKPASGFSFGSSVSPKSTFGNGAGHSIERRLESKLVESLNLEESNPEWKSEQKMLHAVVRPHIVQFSNKVYAFGGSNKKVTQEFDPALNEWRMRRQMPGHCYYGAVVALGDKIYVVGGSEKVCFSYDPENDEWKVLSKPTHGYDGIFPFATVWKGKILLGDKEHVEEYDPIDDRWSNRDELLPEEDIRSMILHAPFTLYGNQ
ncbi:hypothetical protein CAPTEDRAFT_189418 [Capitella teleta]|uniref:BTB domain-containing protein n=1 Tax=Capitella teleta TaxID=283909 RepID=R7VAB3_CAPTE|nr:hypothetical protein CAPTEDRAFT_189418 [Capitella teleta]|eukprot:ELU15554.1 hypothetical protein CAPTEDRAFT_189418 [Capitella teleta]